MRDYTRLDAFLDDREKEVYSEPPGGGDEIISKMVPELISHYDIQPSAKVLDVGCGKGFALEKFRDHGCETVGITLGEDAGHCRANGFKIFEADMSFLNLEEGDFDVIWCRHVMEHSIFPYFTLSEMYRLLKTNGVFYIEVPAPDTCARHETNKNHYSVFTQGSWQVLITRAGFKISQSRAITFEIDNLGTDKYYVFDGQKF